MEPLQDTDSTGSELAIEALAGSAALGDSVTGLQAEVGVTVTNGAVICELKD